MLPFILDVMKLADIRPLPMDGFGLGTMPHALVPLLDSSQERPLGAILHCQVRLGRSGLAQPTLLDKVLPRNESLNVEIIHDRTDVNGVEGRSVDEEMDNRSPEVLVVK